MAEMNLTEKRRTYWRVIRRYFSTPRHSAGFVLSWVGVFSGAIGLFNLLTRLFSPGQTWFPIALFDLYEIVFTPPFAFILESLRLPGWTLWARDIFTVYWALAAAGLRLSDAYHALERFRVSRKIAGLVSFGYDDPEEEESFKAAVAKLRAEYKQIGVRQFAEGLRLSVFAKIPEILAYLRVKLRNTHGRADDGLIDIAASVAQVKFMYANGLLQLIALPASVFVVGVLNAVRGNFN